MIYVFGALEDSDNILYYPDMYYKLSNGHQPMHDSLPSVVQHRAVNNNTALVQQISLIARMWVVIRLATGFAVDDTRQENFAR